MYQATINDFSPARQRLITEALTHPSELMRLKLINLTLKCYPSSPLQLFVRAAITQIEKSLSDSRK